MKDPNGYFFEKEAIEQYYYYIKSSHKPFNKNGKREIHDINGSCDDLNKDGIELFKFTGELMCDDEFVEYFSKNPYKYN